MAGGLVVGPGAGVVRVFHAPDDGVPDLDTAAFLSAETLAGERHEDPAAGMVPFAAHARAGHL